MPAISESSSASGLIAQLVYPEHRSCDSVMKSVSHRLSTDPTSFLPICHNLHQNLLPQEFLHAVSSEEK